MYYVIYVKLCSILYVFSFSNIASVFDTWGLVSTVFSISLLEFSMSWLPFHDDLTVETRVMHHDILGHMEGQTNVKAVNFQAC